MRFDRIRITIADLLKALWEIGLMEIISPWVSQDREIPETMFYLGFSSAFR